MEDVWPQSELPELIDSAAVVDLTKYDDKVLSEWATRRYGWEYDMEVGFDVAEVLAWNASRVFPASGEDDLVDGDDADRDAESINGCSSAAVASRESSSSPWSESLSSCNPTLQPLR
jgi:hypothetical protein